MKNLYNPIITFAAAAVTFLHGCSVQGGIRELQRMDACADISIADYSDLVFSTDTSYFISGSDSVTVTEFDGREVLLMSAVKDEETGEMMISDRIDPIVVQAKFRNVPERAGEINLAFDITVPALLCDSRWQLRLSPKLSFLEDSVGLDKVFITGKRYRAEQMRGYSLYEKFISSIIPDTCNFEEWFTFKRLLDIFYERNFRGSDTSFFGTTFRDAVEYYSKSGLIRRNERKIAEKEQRYARYIRNPIVKEGVRLDSVIINDTESSIKYCYRQTINARKGLKKVTLSIDGELYDSDRMIYKMPPAPALTYYVSSVNGLMQRFTRYKSMVVERNLMVNIFAVFDFRQGSDEFDGSLGMNAAEMSRIEKNIGMLFQNDKYVVDSLVITASSSPEGSYRFNKGLSERRGESIRKHIIGHFRKLSDSANNSLWEIYYGTHGKGMVRNDTHGKVMPLPEPQVKVSCIAENWELFHELVQLDTLLRKDTLISFAYTEQDPDLREKILGGSPNYEYIKENIYPKLRIVNFDFHLHRPGMIKDTVHTKIVDTVYMEGLNALEEFDYKRAVAILQPYADINSAVAYLCMDYNLSALAILEKLPQSAAADYLRAIACARLNRDDEAAASFLSAVGQEPGMKYRGNLDPEISRIICKYDLESIYK